MNKPTKRIIRISLLIGTIASMFFVPWILVKAWISPLPDTIQGQLDEAINLGFDGMIVYVDRSGEPPAFYGAGWKNRENKIPADPHSLFKIASVGKLYTAVAISKLAFDKSLSLDDTLADYFPELIDRIEYADKITIRMLVRHRSGIPDYIRTHNYWVHPKDNDKERLELVLDQKANFKPGTDYEYSNTNYLLLAKLIERVTGQSKFQFIKEQILDPLNLKSTFGSIHDVDLNDVMSGYYIGYENDLKTDDNGVMLATAEDLGKFIRALNDGTVFKDKKEQDIYTSIYKYEHTGLIPGYQTIAKYHKDINAVVIQFTNTVVFDGYNWNLSEIIYNRIVKILKNKTTHNNGS
ncbi:serine hydrolase domain-containing protein [Membranihabitans maritimus]|uniref:serine hydrolase domain-containing protein n=1 Tax=Membranihabitans maritimus TaxID=2904244 RepID=UPI001F16760B|nr:serine hydrolase domain-containing protein [Membranihabitans maritimus]